jgi:hypothetical protein
MDIDDDIDETPDEIAQIEYKNKIISRILII